jgi:3-hydroxyisobutyrate dehydrogenase-like beta-hydroxyacid dehydrogenase
MPKSTSPSLAPCVALIGFGEAGERFARAGDWAGHTRGWDISPDRRALMQQFGIETGNSPEEALQGAGVAISLVTADAALLAAQQYAALLPQGALWCDMNSVSPDTKRTAAEVVEAAGGRYVDVAVMAPVDSELAVPLLIAGPHAIQAEELLGKIGFSNMRVVGDTVGKASAIKMIRSVMVKGIEALSYECSEAAEAAGVYDYVTASLDASEVHRSWADRIAYNRERMEKHGLRRAAEMEESAKTLQGLGVEPVMTRSTVQLQREVGMKSRTREKTSA